MYSAHGQRNRYEVTKKSQFINSLQNPHPDLVQKSQRLIFLYNTILIMNTIIYSVNLSIQCQHKKMWSRTIPQFSCSIISVCETDLIEYDVFLSA